MSRVYFVHDGQGARRLGEQDLPLPVGGAQVGGILVPDLPADALVAYIGLSEGHAFIQPAETDAQLFHNHERLTASRWLKSGDVVEVGDWLIHWLVQGDQVDISVHERPPSPRLTPPTTPAPVNSRTLPEASPAAVPRSGPRILGRLALGFFLLLLIAVAFVLSATPISVRITPAPTQLSLDGLFPSVSIAGRRLALPGEYLVSAEHPGYRPLRKKIQVLRDGYQVFEIPLEELPGLVAIELRPAVPFRLLVDDAAVATDERLGAEIPGGRHRLRIETERHLPIEEDLEIAGKGQLQRLTYVLQPAWARVAIDSEPTGATVTVDGEPRGVTPLETELLQGERTLVLSLEKYKSQTVEQTIRAGVDLTLDTVRLQPLDGRVSIRSEPAAASVTVDDAFQGTTPLTLTLASGVEHRLRLSKPGYRDFDRALVLAADEEQTLEARLQPSLGVVFVTARPADARLRVDGRDMGLATQRLELTTRSHTLEFRKSGYATKTVTITPRAGISQNLDVVLSSVEQQRTAQRASASPPIITGPAGQALRLIEPQGSFRMGSSRREAGRRANESRRLVRLVRPFYLGTTEVSNAQFRQFRPSHDSGSAEGLSLNSDAQPAVNVSWDDAARYCNWLSERSGLPPAYTEVNGRMRPTSPLSTGYRLPSEAEWAYVARRHGAQAEQRYPWPGGFPPQVTAGNFADASIADTLANTVPDYNDGHRVAAPVGTFAARPAGFYDLGGNVAEWMHDYYAVYPGEANSAVTDPLGPAVGDHHVVRDSSWRQGTIAELRLSYRDYSRAARPDLGFRVARYAH